MDPQPEESKLDKVIWAVKQLNVEPFLFLIMFGMSIRDVTIQSVMMDRACRLKLDQTQEICMKLNDYPDIKDTVQKITLNYRIALILISSIPAVVCATLLSPWSDRYGRKFPMMASVTGLILEGIGTTIVSKVSSAPLYYFLFVHIPSGIFGGYLVAISSTYTYLSDTTTQETRAIRFAILEFFLVIATPLGIEIGGQIYKYDGAIPVLIIAVVSQIACFLWIVFAIKETRGINENKNFKEMTRHLFTLENFKETIKTCIAKRPGNFRAQIWLMILSASLGIFCMMGSASIGFMFVNKMYGWENPEYSTVSAITKFFQGVGVIVSVPIFTKVLDMPDSIMVLIGTFSYMGENSIKTVAYQKWMYYYACVVSILAGTANVAIRSRLSKMVTQNELSKVFSLLASCEALTPALGFLIYGKLYSASLTTFPGASYLLSTLLLTIVMGIFIWIKKQGPPPTSHEISEGGYKMGSFADEQ